MPSVASLKHPFKAEIESIRGTIPRRGPGIHEGISGTRRAFARRRYFATVQPCEKASAASHPILHLGAKLKKLAGGRRRDRRSRQAAEVARGKTARWSCSRTRTRPEGKESRLRENHPAVGRLTFERAADNVTKLRQVLAGKH